MIKVIASDMDGTLLGDVPQDRTGNPLQRSGVPAMRESVLWLPPAGIFPVPWRS
mgnify:CR=1 FL=1